MPLYESETPHVATMDVCLAGVFIPKGEKIPPDLYEQWERRLRALGLEDERTQPESAR